MKNLLANYIDFDTMRRLKFDGLWNLIPSQAGLAFYCGALVVQELVWRQHKLEVIHETRYSS